MSRILTLAAAIIAFGVTPALACGGAHTSAAMDGETPTEQTKIPEKPAETNGS
ncbi:MAG: hypothetical protein Alpg2KO_05340 [Alphaproteobacteria bacterium]